MKRVLYILSLLLVLCIICYGVTGIMGTAVSYKFQIEDPAVEINIQSLEKAAQKTAYTHLSERRQQLEIQLIWFYFLIISWVIAFILLVVKRKRIINK